MRTISKRQENNPENQKLNIILFLVYFLILLILEFTVFRPYLNIVSIDFAEKIRNYLFFILMNDTFIYISYFLCSKWIFVFISILIFNYSTIYKLYIFIQNIFISCFIVSVLQILLKDSLVYYNSNVKFPLKPCITFFGTPSVFVTLSTVGIFTLRHLFVLDGFLSKYKRAYLLTFITCLVYIISVSIINLFSFVNSIDQIVFGFFLGFGIYYFVFYIIKVQCDKGRQFLNLIKLNMLYHFIITFLPLIFLGLIYFVFHTSEIFLENLNKKITGCKCQEINNTDFYFRESKFSIILGSLISLNLIIIIAIKLEYQCIFPCKDNDWMHYNFNNDTKSVLEESFYSDISIGEKETRWNKTGIIVSLIRLLTCLVVCFGILCFFHFCDLKTENIFFFISYNSLFPMGIIIFFLFYTGKCLFRCFNLSNECVIILSG